MFILLHQGAVCNPCAYKEQTRSTYLTEQQLCLNDSYNTTKNKIETTITHKSQYNLCDTIYAQYVNASQTSFP